jgi:hypothetical protein
MNRATYRLSEKGIVLVFLISFLSGINNDLHSQYADIENDPLEWFCEPHSVFSSEVKMSVKVPDIQEQLEYCFECVEGDGYSSKWQASNEFKNSGLKPETTYSYNTPDLREEFIEDAKHSFQTFIPGDEYAIDPFPEYRDFFNLYAIWWSGMPAYNWKEGLTPVDLDEIRDRLFLPWNREGKGWVSCLAMVNSDGGGGGAARNIETRTGNAMIAGKETEAFIHEFAHTAPGLPDEYTSNGVWGKGGEGSNTTLDYIAEDVKWRAWIEPGTEVPTPYSPENMDKVGVFEGATHRLHHIYRPTARGCIMGAGSFAGDPDGLCPVCIQRTVCRLYMWVDPFDNSYPARKELYITIPGNVHLLTL